MQHRLRPRCTLPEIPALQSWAALARLRSARISSRVPPRATRILEQIRQIVTGPADVLCRRWRCGVPAQR